MPQRLSEMGRRDDRALRQPEVHVAYRDALFFEELRRQAGMLGAEAEKGIAELVALGMVTSDSFAGLRALLVDSKFRTKGKRRPQGNGI